MASPALMQTLVTFRARVHRTKNRLISIPAEQQRALGLVKRRDNHLLLVSLRKAGVGRWNHHYVKLTYDNEFSIPSDVTHIQSGDAIDVKVHRVIEDRPLKAATDAYGAAILVAWLDERGKGWRKDGSARVDEYLAEDIDV